jgi:hypothetical protein
MDRATTNERNTMTDQAFIDALTAAFPDVESCDVQDDLGSLSVMLDEEDTEMLINDNATSANGWTSEPGFTVEVFDGDGILIGTAQAATRVEGVTAAKAIIDQAAEKDARKAEVDQAEETDADRDVDPGTHE